MKDDDGWKLRLPKFWSAEYITMGVLGFGFLVSCVDHESLVLLGLIEICFAYRPVQNDECL